MMQRPTWLALSVLVVLALAMAACGTSAPAATDTTDTTPSAETSPSAADSPSAEPGGETGGDAETVALTGFAFAPEELTISAGTEVTFVNEDAAAHTVTEGTDGTAVDDPIIDEELGGGAETSFTFDEPGTYELTCRFHPTMQMTVVVEG